MKAIPSVILAVCAVPGVTLLSLAVSAQNPAAPGTQTRTATFMVSVMVDNDCRISSSNPLEFGHVAPALNTSTGTWLAAADWITHFSVICSKNTRYMLYLDQGSAANSTVSRRLMSGATPGNTDQLQYQLYLDPTYSTIWGNGASGSANGVSGIGSGAPQPYSVYGRILQQEIPNPDLYSSMITALLTF
jgi:spore coat protein U-like protein